MPMNRIARRTAITVSVGRRVLRLGRLERRHAGRDRLGAGQGDGARRERPQEQEDRERLERSSVAWRRSSGVGRRPRRGRRSGTRRCRSSAAPSRRTGRSGPRRCCRPRAGRAGCAIVIRPIAATPMSTRSSNRAGNAETICSTADDVETATVRM